MHVDESIKSQIKGQLVAQQAAKAKEKEAKDERKAPGRFSGRADRIEVSGILRELGTLIEAGYPLPRALALLGRNTSNLDLASTIEDLRTQVEKGGALSKAMGRYPWYFDGVMVNIVKASEGGGKLDRGLEYISDMVDFDQEIRDRVSQALMYPAILFATTSLIVIGMMIFIVPLFAGYVREAGAQFTGMSAIVLGVSEMMRSPAWIVLFLGTIVGVVYGGYRWRQANELQFDTLIGRIPIVGRLMLLAAVARFVNMFHMLTVNGVGLLQTLDLAKGALGNAYLRRAIDEMHASVESGKTLAEPLRKFHAFPPVAADMISVAEESGRLEKVLGSLSKTMRTELRRSATKITIILEPIMLLVLGVVALTVVVSFFIPYFDLLTAVGSMK
jgi:type IV pilus assembly protein PilC